MNQMLQDSQVQDSPVQDSPVQDSEVQDSKAQDAKAQASGAKGAPDAVEPPATPAHPRFARPQRIAFVQACWHREVVEEAKVAFLAEIEARHIPRDRVDIFEVPGSFEIPLHAQLLAKTRRYTAIVAAGLVVDGGI